MRSLRGEEPYGVDDSKSMRILNNEASNLLWVSRWIKYRMPVGDRFGTKIVINHVTMRE